MSIFTIGVNASRRLAVRPSLISPGFMQLAVLSADREVLVTVTMDTGQAGALVDALAAVSEQVAQAVGVE